MTELRAITRRPMTVLVLGGVFALCVVDAAQPLGRPPLGLVGSVALNTDGSLTYGLAGSALLTGLVVAGYNDLADLWHARGIGLFERLVRTLLYSVPIAAAVRLVAVAGILVGGAIDGARRGWRWGSLVPVDRSEMLTGQARVLIAYLVIAAFGSLVALVCRSQAVTASVVLAMTAVYVPFVGAIANRAGPVLDVLPWLPFGAVRGAVSGNGAILGTDPTQARVVETLPASLVFIGWLVAVAAWYLLRPAAGTGDRAWVMYAVPVPASLALVCVAGLALPAAMDGHVPWRWSPEWRHAKAEGQDSRQVSELWAERAGHQADITPLFVSAAAARAVPDDARTVLRNGNHVTVAPESSMLSPEYTRVTVEFHPARRSGTLLIDRAQFQLRLKQVGKTWRIVRVEGPFVRVQAAP